MVHFRGFGHKFNFLFEMTSEVLANVQRIKHQLVGVQHWTWSTFTLRAVRMPTGEEGRRTRRLKNNNTEQPSCTRSAGLQSRLVCVLLPRELLSRCRAAFELQSELQSCFSVVCVCDLRPHRVIRIYCDLNVFFLCV